MALGISSTTEVEWTGTGAGTTSSIVVPATGFLVASISSDSETFGAGDVTFTVAGGSLTWTLRKRQSGQPGDAEIWTAYNASGSTMTVSATPAGVGSDVANGHEMQVLVFTGAESSWSGATAGGTGNGSNPSVALTTTATGSYVVACSSDFANDTPAPTPASGQSLTNSYLQAGHFTGAHWRTTSSVTGSGTVVTMALTAPSSQQWNAAVIEVRPAAGAGTNIDMNARGGIVHLLGGFFGHLDVEEVQRDYGGLIHVLGSRGTVTVVDLTPVTSVSMTGRGGLAHVLGSRGTTVIATATTGRGGLVHVLAGPGGSVIDETSATASTTARGGLVCIVGGVGVVVVVETVTPPPDPPSPPIQPLSIRLMRRRGTRRRVRL